MIWQDGCMAIIGITFVIVGILVRSGGLRATYWLVSINYYRAAAYSLIPIGISLLVAVTARPFLDTPWIVPLRAVMITCFVVGLFMWLFEPRFAKPDWINWVEDNHGDIVPELRREIGRMKGSERKRIINDQVALEEWIAEFRRRR